MLIDLRDKLQPAFPRDSKKFDAHAAAVNWHLIITAEKEVERNRSRQKELALELWGFLVSACEAIVRFADWPSASKRWKTVRRVLLAAAYDPLPETEENESNPNATVTTWSCPCPRVDVAGALPLLAYRLGKCDSEMAQAIRKLSRDPSQPVRFHLAESLSGLWKPAPEVMWSLCDDIIQNEKNFYVLAHLVGTLDWLAQRDESAALGRIATIADRSKTAEEENPIHKYLASAFLFNYVRTGNPQCKTYVDSLVSECDTERVYHALTSLLHNCRAGGWLTAGSADTPDPNADEVRKRTWGFFLQLVTEAQKRLHERMGYAKQHEPLAENLLIQHETAVGAALKLMDGVAAQLFFVSGAFEEKKTAKSKDDKERLTESQTRRLWFDAKPVFQQLVKGWHPHTTYELVQTLNHVMKYDPRDAFLLAAESIRNSASAGFQREPLAVPEVVKLIQHALADHRDLFRIDKGADNACLDALLAILDLFVEAGWPEARQLTHRLEEIYR